MVQSTDFYPTLLQIMELDPGEGQAFDDVSILPAFKGQPFSRDAIFTCFPHNPPVPDWIPPSISVHHENWKLIREFHQGDNGAHRYRLFDLSKEIGEKNNLAARNSELVQTLDTKIEAFLKESKAVVSIPNPKFDPAKYQPEPEGKNRVGRSQKKPFKKTAKTDDFDSKLQGWNARNASDTIKDGIVTLISTSPDPFLGIGAKQLKRKTTISPRVKSPSGRKGKITWGNGTPKIQSVNLTLKKTTTPILTIAGCALTMPLQATILFHSDFDEASLGAIGGLNIDTPSTVGPDSGTVTLDTGNQKLDLTANGANLWTAREGAPIAWVSTPSVGIGETWYAQTQITHTNGTGVNTTWDQSGMTFYSGTPGANPGSENTGTHQSLFFGVNNWNAWEHKVQGLADNNPSILDAANTGDDTFEYRVEVTENGTSDLYNFFYREDSADPWTQLGAPDLSQDFDNTAVGLFMKSHNNNTTASTEFDYFTVGTVDAIPEPGTGMLAGLAGLALVMRRRRK